jgi:AICAR transformylase/IMP cyclohydrolase PurH
MQQIDALQPKLRTLHLPQDVAVVVDPSDYDELLAALGGDAAPEEALAFRKRLAWKAYQHTASYDSQVGAAQRDVGMREI